MILGSVLLAIVAAIATCEWLGWPFLRAPIERAIERRVQRDVTIAADFRLSLISGIRLSADSFSIGPPEDRPKQAPEHFVEASNVELELPYSTLIGALRGSGEPLRVSSLRVAQLDAELWRDANGRSNWQFGPEGEQAGAPVVLPRFDHLVVREGRFRIDDAISHVRLTASVRTNEGAAAGSRGTPAREAGLQISADGTFDGRPVRARIRSSGLLPLAESTPTSEPQPISLQVKSGASEFRFDGEAGDLLHLHSLNGRFDVSGRTLADAGDTIGITLPGTPPFRVRGRVRKDDVVWSADLDSFEAGRSRLAGEFRYDPRPDTPLLSGTLRGDLLVLGDLAPSVGASPEGRPDPNEVRGASRTKNQQSQRQGSNRDRATKSAKSGDAKSGDAKAGAPPPAAARSGNGSGRVLPSREFDIPSLRAMNASVDVDLKRVDLSTSVLQSIAPMKTKVELRDGVLELDDITARTAGGQLRGDLSIDPNQQPPLWTANLRWSGIDLARWLRPRNKAAKGEPNGFVTGSLYGSAEVRGAGRSTAHVLGSLNGTVTLWVRDGGISHLVVEATGLDVAQGLGLLVVGDKLLPMQCAVMQFQAKDGTLHAEVGMLDTRDSTVFVRGSISMADEKLDLVLSSKPKDFSPLTVRAPVRVEGTFGNPEVRLQTSTIGTKLVASAVLAAINPLAALIPLMDPADPATRHCSDALENMRSSAAGKPPLKADPRGREATAPPARARAR